MQKGGFPVRLLTPLARTRAKSASTAKPPPRADRTPRLRSMPSSRDPVDYIEAHGVADMLHGAVNELAREQPDDSISFLINCLLKAATERGQETSVAARMRSIQATLQLEQADALALQQENDALKRGGAAAAPAPEKANTKAKANEKANAALTDENAKLQCRITHLLRALDDMEQKYEGGSK